MTLDLSTKRSDLFQKFGVFFAGKKYLYRMLQMITNGQSNQSLFFEIERITLFESRSFVLIDIPKKMFKKRFFNFIFRTLLRDSHLILNLE